VNLYLPEVRLSEADKQDIARMVAEELRGFAATKDPALWSRQQVKEYFGCGETKLKNYMQMRDFPLAHGTGRKRYWRPDDIKTWFARVGRAS
jgi:hypothetical protein